MRLFIAIFIVLVTASCPAPYFDLRHPIYMVTENSFWSGCDKDPAGSAACHRGRVKNMYDGISQWLDYFPPKSRPRVVIVFFREDVPPSLQNDAVYLQVSDNFCDHESDAACYYGWQTLGMAYATIVFVDPSQIKPHGPHEFGHVIGRDDNDVPPDQGSVMSYKHPTPVTKDDFIRMCQLHVECRLLISKTANIH